MTWMNENLGTQTVIMNDVCLGSYALITCPGFIPVSYTIHQLMEKPKENKGLKCTGQGFRFTHKAPHMVGKAFLN